jgi:hypothetical protein
MLDHAVLEYHASVQRLKDLSAADVPSAVNLMTRMIDALEAYLRVAPPTDLGSGAEPGASTRAAPPRLIAIAAQIVDENEAALVAAARLEGEAKDRADAEAPAEIPLPCLADTEAPPREDMSG